MTSPELKEHAKEAKQASAKVEAKAYVPAKEESEAKEDLPDVDKAYEAPKDPKEAPEKTPADLQKEILAKPHMQQHHRERLQKKTDELVDKADVAGLEQLNKGIDFTDKGGLILHTPEGDLKFSAKKVTYDDIKNIEGIEKDKNVWTDNGCAGTKGLWVNFDAIQKLQKAGKKICTKEQYLAVVNISPGGDGLRVDNGLNSAENFFDLLGVENYGFRNSHGGWDGLVRYLRSASATGDSAYGMLCGDAEGGLDLHDKNYAFSIRFLED